MVNVPCTRDLGVRRFPLSCPRFGTPRPSQNRTTTSCHRSRPLRVTARPLHVIARRLQRAARHCRRTVPPPRSTSPSTPGGCLVDHGAAHLLRHLTTPPKRFPPPSEVRATSPLSVQSRPILCTAASRSVRPSPRPRRCPPWRRSPAPTAFRTRPLRCSGSPLPGRCTPRLAMLFLKAGSMSARPPSSVESRERSSTPFDRFPAPRGAALLQRRSDARLRDDARLRTTLDSSDLHDRSEPTSPWTMAPHASNNSRAISTYARFGTPYAFPGPDQPLVGPTGWELVLPIAERRPTPPGRRAKGVSYGPASTQKAGDGRERSNLQPRASIARRELHAGAGPTGQRHRPHRGAREAAGGRIRVEALRHGEAGGPPAAAAERAAPAPGHGRRGRRLGGTRGGREVRHPEHRMPRTRPSGPARARCWTWRAATRSSW